MGQERQARCGRCAVPDPLPGGDCADADADRCRAAATVVIWHGRLAGQVESPVGGERGLFSDLSPKKRGYRCSHSQHNLSTDSFAIPRSSVRVTWPSLPKSTRPVVMCAMKWC